MAKRATLVLAIAIACGAAVPLIAPGIEIALVTCIALGVLIPIGTKFCRGTLDLFEPLVPAAAAFLLFFVARPIVDIASDDRSFASTDVSRWYVDALFASLLAVAGFMAGYFSLRPRDVATQVPGPRDDFAPFSAVLYSGALIAAAGFSLIGSTLLLGGGIGGVLLSRNEIDLNAAINIPILSFGVSLALPAMLVLWRVRRVAGPVVLVLIAAAGAVILLQALPKGNRRDLLPIFATIGVLYYLRRGTRPRIWSVAAVSLLIFLLVITPIRSARTNEVSYMGALENALVDPLGAIGELITSQDTAMIDTAALAIGAIGDDGPIPFEHGGSVLVETILQPIPRAIWEEKPIPIRTQLIDYFYGYGAGLCVSQCPTFSVVTSLFADFGNVSVLVGCAAIGILYRAWYIWFLRRRKNYVAQAAYSVFLTTAFLLWWSNLGLLIASMGVYIVPLLVASWFAGRARVIPQSPGIASPNSVFLTKP